MKFSFTIFILLGILVLVYFIVQENEKNNNENIKIKNKKKNNKKTIDNLNKDSLIEKYNDTISEKINYEDVSSNESIFDNNENYDNVFHNFIESSEFKGEKNGYIFKNGEQGLGYYIDRFKKCLNSQYIYICSDKEFDFLD
tara:strand:- start:1077 stop:1499 length:423 start_codon:yes stop_codon:yes gene_type:complete